MQTYDTSLNSIAPVVQRVVTHPRFHVTHVRAAAAHSAERGFRFASASALGKRTASHIADSDDTHHALLLGPTHA